MIVACNWVFPVSVIKFQRRWGYHDIPARLLDCERTRSWNQWSYCPFITVSNNTLKSFI